MTHSVWFILVIVSVAVTWGHPMDLGPQTFQEYIKPQEKYMEVIMYLTPTQIRALKQGQRLDESKVLAQNPQLQAGLINSVQQNQHEEFRERLEQQQKNIQNLLQELAIQRSQLLAVKNYTELQNAELKTQEAQQPIGNQFAIPRYNHDQYKQLVEELIVSSQQGENKHYFKTEIPASNQYLVDGNYLNIFDNIKQPLLKQELPKSSEGPLFRPNNDFLKAVQDQQSHQAHFVFDPLLEQKFQLIPYEYIAAQQKEHQQLGKELLMENQGQMFLPQANEGIDLQKQQESRKQQELQKLHKLQKQHELQKQQELQKQYDLQKQQELQKQERQQQQLEQQQLQQLQQKQKEQERLTHLDMIKYQQDLKFQYAPNFNDHRYTSEIQNALKSLYFDRLKSKAEAEAIANSPPIVIHKDITIKKHRPNVIIKSVNVPVAAPFLVPYPQPYEVKYPQPYAVPVEIIKPYAVPIVKTEKIEVEKPVPVAVEKRVPVEVERKVYVKVDKPYSVERIVPVEVKKEIPIEVPLYRPEKLTILRHIWQH